MEREKKKIKKKKKSRPTDPNFFQPESGNKPIFFLGLISLRALLDLTTPRPKLSIIYTKYTILSEEKKKHACLQK